MRKATPPVHIFKKADATAWMPELNSSDHKASRGRSLILAGSSEYPGAGILAARGALRAGSGYVTLAQKNIAISSLENPDFLLADLAKKSLKELSFDAVVIGPGFGVQGSTADLLKDLVSQNTKNVVVDADALIVGQQKNLFPFPSSWVVTPHTGELARCLGISVEEINRDRVGAVLKAYELFKCTVVLKGHGTLVYDGRALIKIASGNAALAKAGTGDVLAGVITAFLAQGLKPLRAAALGAYVHGATANLWVARKQDPLSMTASDVIELISRVLYVLRLKT